MGQGPATGPPMFSACTSVPTRLLDMSVSLEGFTHQIRCGYLLLALLPVSTRTSSLSCTRRAYSTVWFDVAHAATTQAPSPSAAGAWVPLAPTRQPRCAHPQTCLPDALGPFSAGSQGPCTPVGGHVPTRGGSAALSPCGANTAVSCEPQRLLRSRRLNLSLDRP